MSLAETSVLAVELRLNGVTAYTSGMAKAEASTATLGRTAGAGLSSGLAKAEKGLNSLSGRLGHAKGAIGGLLTGPLGVLGLSAGIFSLGAVLEQTIGKTTDFAFSVEKLMGLTGGTAESMSGLLAVFEKFGIDAQRTGQIVGFAEKSIGNLGANAGAAAKFQAEFGFSITGANGKVKDFNTVLLQASDYYNSNRAASEKAALAAKLFGRGYADLVPILKLGSKGILDAEAAAKDLGLTLTSQNAVDLKDYRENLRELGDAASGLQLQIGLALVPSINDMAKSLTSFVRDNRVGIVQFFKDAATNVGKFGNFLAKDVIPPLQAFGSAASTAWNAVPGPLKQILIGGIIANKAGKFLFDISIKDAVGGIGDLGKGLLSRGSPANPMFVKDVGGLGGLGGAAGGLGESAGVAGLGTIAAIAAIPLALIVAAELADPNHVKGGGARDRGVPGAGAGGFLGIDVNALGPKGGGGGGPTRPTYLPGGGTPPDERGPTTLENLTAIKADTTGLWSHARAVREAAQALHLLADKNWIKGLEKGIHERSVAKFGGTGKGSAAETATYQHDILGKAATIMRHSGTSAERLARLQQLSKEATGATKETKRVLSQDLQTLSKRVLAAKPPQVTVNVATAVDVSANSVVAKFHQQRRFGPTDSTSKHNGFGID